ncbi:MAG: glycosyltransferase family 2 protein [Dehalococcoidia bacterium]|nr:glycosyltransferase family 2 protein [Dehalococcoidia bacterium]
MREDKPLVSVIIPTMNSEDVIGDCLASVKDQSYSNIETLVVDSKSTDQTKDIIGSFSAKFISYEGKLLGARYAGFLQSQADFILLLDSDQILEPTAVERALLMMDSYDMLALEELSYKPRSFFERLYEADRRLIHLQPNFDPLEGNLLPRFFKREILEKAFRAIPREIIPVVIHHDHAIIYFEAHKVSSKVGILPASVYHKEHGLIKTWRINFRYGRSLRGLLKDGYYRKLVRGRDKGFREGIFKFKDLWVRSFVLLLFTKMAQRAGYLSGRLKW